MESLNDTIAYALESGRQRKTPCATTARACMTQELIVVSPRQTLREAMGLLLKHRISGMPVTEGNHYLVGILSEIDCLRAMASSSYESTPYVLDRPVEDLMSRKLVTVSPTTEVFSLVRLFEQHQLRRLPVVEENVLVGQVSRRDILRALARLT